MCGIFAFYNMYEQGDGRGGTTTEDASSLENLTLGHFHSSSAGYPDLIKHRGPDESRYMNIPVPTIGGTVHLAFHRLAINGTTQAGSQPFNHEDQVYLLANGEIYNHLWNRIRRPTRVTVRLSWSYT